MTVPIALPLTVATFLSDGVHLNLVLPAGISISLPSTVAISTALSVVRFPVHVEPLPSTSSPFSLMLKILTLLGVAVTVTLMVAFFPLDAVAVIVVEPTPLATISLVKSFLVTSLPFSSFTTLPFSSLTVTGTISAMLLFLVVHVTTSVMLLPSLRSAREVSAFTLNPLFLFSSVILTVLEV